MRIVIAGGRTQADFIANNLQKGRHKLVIINDDAKYCEQLAAQYHVPVIHGDPSKYEVLKDADIEGFDVCIALTHRDADNLAICQYAKRSFGIKKVVCTVGNPKNVDLFRKLGVNNVISAGHMVAQYITQTTTLENIIKTLSLEEERVLITEVIVEPHYQCVGKQLKDLSLPSNTIIGCVIRKNADMIVPSGKTELLAGDKLLILSSPEHQKKALAAITR